MSTALRSGELLRSASHQEAGAVQGLGGTLEQIPIWGAWTLGEALALWALLGSVDGSRRT
jgi:hypothetical protein